MKKVKIDEKFSKIIQEYSFKKTKSHKLNIIPIAEAKVDKNSFTLVSVTNVETPNSGSFAIAIDGEGKLFTEAQLFEIYKKDIFLGPIGPLPLLRLDEVTISPTINDLILNLCDKFGERLTVNIPKNPVRNVDIYFLADTTGSMGNSINVIKSNINSIMTTLDSMPSVNAAFGAGNYKDFPSDPYCFKNDIGITTNTVAVANAVNGWTAIGGVDTSEGQLFAFNQIADNPTLIGWRPNSLQIIVWFGDAPGHDPICPVVSPQVLSQINEANTIQKLINQPKLRVLAVSVTSGPGLNADPNLDAGDYLSVGCVPNGVAGQATRITNATQGAFQSGISASNIVNTIITMIQNNLSTIQNVKIVPTGNIASFLCSISPKVGYSNLKTDVAHRQEFIVCFKGTVPCGIKDKNYFGTFDVVMDDVVVASKKVRIEVPSCQTKGKCSCNCC